MARVTVEDCLKNVKNRFELVMIAAKRARQLAMGDEDPMVEWENDKATVVALREVAEGHIDESILLAPVKSEEPEELLKAAVAEAAAQAEESSSEKTSEAQQTEKPESGESEQDTTGEK